MVDKITIDIRMSYQAVVNKLGKLDELRVDHQYEENGVSHVVLRERTLGEWFSETFSRDHSSVKKSREAVLNALEPMMKKSGYPDQLFQNMRDRVDHGYGVSGRKLKRDFQPIPGGGRPMPLRGGTVAAISQGNSVQLLEGEPAKIKCSHAVLRTSTAIAEASRHSTLRSVEKNLQDFVSEDPDQAKATRSQPIPPRVSPVSFAVNVAASRWSCITDLQLPELLTNQATIPSTDLEDLVTKAVGDQSGAVVIEVIPDHLEEHGLKRTYSYTNDGLRTQIKTAVDLVSNAKKDKKDLVITFACKDVSVLNRIRDIDRFDAALEIGAIKQDGIITV